MNKKKHHYVPQFYLRFFSSDKGLIEKPKRIHLFNIKGNFVKENVSIKDQCYKRNFYGDTDEIEDNLSVFESAYSQVLSRIINSGKLPMLGYYDYQVLLNFVIVQHLRSKRQVDFQEDMWDGMMKSVLGKNIDNMSSEQWENVLGKGEEPITREQLENTKIGVDYPAILSLSSANDAAQYSLFDLGLHLILTNEERRFITSDNPVVLYNQYFQGVKDMSFTGFLSRGLQIFLPLSPYCLLLLYDKDVYYLKDNSGVTYDLTLSELKQINLLQFVNSDQNLFFNNSNQIPDLKNLQRLSIKYRKENRAQTVVADEYNPQSGKARSSLIHSFVEDLDINLNLRFIKLKRSIKKQTLREKMGNRFRKEMPPEFMPHYDLPSDIPKKFIKRKDQGKI